VPPLVTLVPFGASGLVSKCRESRGRGYFQDSSTDAHARWCQCDNTAPYGVLIRKSFLFVVQIVLTATRVRYNKSPNSKVRVVCRARACRQQCNNPAHRHIIM